LQTKPNKGKGGAINVETVTDKNEKKKSHKQAYNEPEKGQDMFLSHILPLYTFVSQ
jgi:hypothetical protein